MATKKKPNADADLMMRTLARESMKAGMEMGFDKATQLVERISEAWGESQTMAVELRKMRAKVLGDMVQVLTDATGAPKAGG